MAEQFANYGHPDQTSYSVASDLGLRCLPTIIVSVTRLNALIHLIRVDFST